MPLQNRVDPAGNLIVTSGRGTLMGNRGGVIHNQNREITRNYRGIRWITCLLEFKGRRRTVMTPGLYTELFFLDEAVSLAAGHRPCAECRRERFNAFRSAFQRARCPPERSSPVRAPEIDADLHQARIDANGAKVTFEARLDTLPDGCFVRIGGASYLVQPRCLLLWSPGGYLDSLPRLNTQMVTVLTPAPIVEVIRQGYIPATTAPQAGQ